MVEKEDIEEGAQEKIQVSGSPLVFISHDSRDAEFAEAFSTLLRNISGSMLKSFRSSDKKGTEGIEYGDEWYKRLMTKLDSASDVVCLFTKRSLERPWILYEAGVAKGKLKTPVYGVALGMPLKKVSTGPFYQFQNCGDSEDELTKLVLQLARRIPGLEPVSDVVRSQVAVFKNKVEELFTNISPKDEEFTDSTVDDTSTAKLFEELKVMFRELPSLVENSLADSDRASRGRKIRRLHPGMFEDIMHMLGPETEPIGILIFASLIRDDAPWLYEIAIEAFRALTSGTQKAVEQIRRSLKLLRDFSMRSPLFEELGMSGGKEMHMLMMEGPRILERMVTRCLEGKKGR